MTVDQVLRSITSRMDVLVYVGRYFQAVFHIFVGKLSIVCVV